MKKLLIVLAVLLAAVSVLGAQAPSFNAKGGVYAEWGLDLDNGTSGLDVGLSDLDFTAALGDAKSIEKVSENDMYGEIIIKNLRISTLDPDASSAASDNNSLTTPFNPGDWGSEAVALRWDTLSARLVFGDMFNIGLWGYKSAYSSYTKYGGLDTNWGFLKNAYDYSLFDGAYGANNVTAAVYNGWDTTNGSPNNRVYFQPHSFVAGNYTTNDGISLNLSIPQVLDFNTYVESYMKWSDTSRFSEKLGNEIPEGDNGYGITTMVGLTAVENLTFKALTRFDLGVPVKSSGASPLALASLASYKISLGEDFSITPAVAFDGQLGDYDGFVGSSYSAQSNDGFDWGLAGGLTVAMKNTTIAVNYGMGSDTTIDDTTTAAANEASEAGTMNLTASMSFGLVDGLLVKAAFEYVDATASKSTGGVAADPATLTGDEKIGVAAEVSYDIKVTEKGVLTPYFKFSTDNKNTFSNYAMFAKFGVTANGILDNTKLYLEWASNDLSGVEVYSDGEVFGQIKLGTKISF